MSKFVALEAGALVNKLNEGMSIMDDTQVQVVKIGECLDKIIENQNKQARHLAELAQMLGLDVKHEDKGGLIV